jgi:FkbM family methyltransferase
MSRPRWPPAVSTRQRVLSLVRRLYVAFARVLAPYVVTTSDETVYVISTRDDGPGGALFVWGSVPEFVVLRRALELLAEHDTARSGTVFVDVGANIGTTVIPALTEHGFERGLAIEPDPENARLLRANAALNALSERLDVVEAAAASEPGQALFEEGKATRLGRRAGAGRMSTAKPSKGASVVSVDVVTIDEALALRSIEPGDVGLLWLDVQGHEGHALAGASRLVEAGRPVVFAVRPKKLAKSGGLEPLVSIATSQYSWIADLRNLPDGQALPEVRPSSALRNVFDSATTTDVLAFGARG